MNVVNYQLCVLCISISEKSSQSSVGTWSLDNNSVNPKCLIRPQASRCEFGINSNENYD